MYLVVAPLFSSHLCNLFTCSGRMTALAAQQLDTFTRREGLSQEHAWNRASPWLIRAAQVGDWNSSSLSYEPPGSSQT